MPVGKQRSKDKRTTTTDGPTTVHDVVREGLKSRKSSRILTGVFLETHAEDDDSGVGTVKDLRHDQGSRQTATNSSSTLD